MIHDKKAGRFSGKWAVVTLHPWLPSRSEQIARARAWGVDERRHQGVDTSALVEDDVRNAKRTTNWSAKLPERAEFIEKMQIFRGEGDTVFFANPLCVGFSEKHARITVEGLFAAGLDIYIHSVHGNGAAHYKAGDDMEEFFESVALMANAKHQSAHRKRKSK